MPATLRTSSRRLVVSLRDERGGARLTAAVLDAALAQLAEAREGDVVVLEGADDTFCAGMDLSLLDQQDDDAARARLPARYGELLAAIDGAPCAVIALVLGDARGGGVGVAAAADIVVASPRATFALPEVLLGLVPAMVFPPLARRIGVAGARRLALGVAPMRADEARLAGLVDEVAGDPHVAVERHATRLARMDGRAVAELKRLVRDHYPAPAGWAADATARFAALAGSDATHARVARFLAGDAPWHDETEAAE